MKALREYSPQARHHFTRLDQVDLLIRAREATADTGFMARLMMLCSLPRTNPGDRTQYKRVNGPYTLIVTAVGQTGLPFGNLSRLLLAWVKWCNAWGDVSRIAFTAPSRPEKASTMGTIPFLLRTMIYFPMFLRQEPQGPFSLLCADHIVVGEGRRFVEETVFVKGYEAGGNRWPESSE